MTANLDLRNVARLGLYQVCIIVGGVLGAAVSARLWNEFGLHGLPSYTPILRDYGFLLLLLPLGWVMAAMVLREKDGGEVWGYFGGWAVLLGLVILLLSATVVPWLRICLLTLSP